MCLTQWKISSPIIHRGLNMWRNYVLQILRIIESFLFVFRIASFVRFDSIIRKGWHEFVYVAYTRKTHVHVWCRFTMFEQRERFRKKKGTKRPLRVAHFSSFSSRFSKMSYQSVSDFIFRFTLSIRRCTTIRSFSCFCQSVLAQYRPLRFHPRKSHSILRMSIASHCSFFPSFSFFITF